MILSDKTIKNLSENKKLITPFNPANLQPASYDLTLSPIIKRQMNEGWRDFDYKNRESENNYLIWPHEFILASTFEVINMPDRLSARIDGKSSIGRMGLIIQTAGYIDPGFSGNITLELYNSSKYPIDLGGLNTICQIVFTKLDKKPLKTYSGHYQNQKGPTISWIQDDSKHATQ